MSRPKKTKFDPAEELQSTEIEPVAAENDVCTAIVVRDMSQPPADVYSPGKVYVLDLCSAVEDAEKQLKTVKEVKAEAQELVDQISSTCAERKTEGLCPPLARARERIEWQELADSVNQSYEDAIDLRDQWNLNLIDAEYELEVATLNYRLSKIARLERKLSAAGVEY